MCVCVCVCWGPAGRWSYQPGGWLYSGVPGPSGKGLPTPCPEAVPWESGGQTSCFQAGWTLGDPWQVGHLLAFPPQDAEPQWHQPHH